jgi:hypothetical protein
MTDDDIQNFVKKTIEKTVKHRDNIEKINHEYHRDFWITYFRYLVRHLERFNKKTDKIDIVYVIELLKIFSELKLNNFPEKIP